jgi:hypothetical protein
MSFISPVASAITFQSTLPGTVSTTLAARANLEVWAEDFGHSTTATAAANDTALVNAITRVFNAGGGTVRLGRGVFQHITVPFNWTAATTVRIVGSGEQATFLQKSGNTASPVLDLSVNAGVLDVYSSIEELTILGNAKQSPGVQATRLASFITRNLGIRACTVAFESLGCLVAQHYKPDWLGNNFGMRCRKSADNIYPNLVQLYGGAIKNNSSIGVDIGEASHVIFKGTDIESNGTAGDVATGGVFIRGTVDDETGFAEISLDGVWFESNLGWTMFVENAGGLSLALREVKLANPEANRNLSVGGINDVLLDNVEAASPGNTIVLTASASCIRGGVINTINDASTVRVHQGVTTGSGLVRNFATTQSIGASGLKIDPAATISDNGSSFAQGNLIVAFCDGAGAGNVTGIYATNGGNGNAAATVMRMGTNSATGRSINAAGTINASGADYAEYEFKRGDCGEFAKGDVVGFDVSGLLTDRWDLAHTFGVKSTKPAMVGGDDWMTEAPPPVPVQPEDGIESVAAWSAYRDAVVLHDEFSARLEAARARVDRIAYAGKVPVNVQGAKCGDWIDAAPREDGGIKAVVVKAPGVNTLGRVRRVLDDGRPVIVL